MTSAPPASKRMVIIVGASVRAMADSARRAGWHVIAIDLFGDDDLRRVADVIHVVPLEDYPDGIIPFLSRYPGTPICYTGGIENFADVLKHLSKAGPLWGNEAEVVARVRNIFELFPRFKSHQILCPTIRRESIDEDHGKRWVKKSLRSAGGLHVTFWDGSVIGPEEYLQEYIPGRACSSLFVGVNGQAQYLGSSRQLLLQEVTTSESFLSRPFQFAGSIGPIDLSEPVTHQLQSLGDLLAKEFELRGVFGVDWIDHEGDVCVIEINPRFTASSEVIEPTLREPVFAHHARAFHPSFPSALVSTRMTPGQQVTGKIILFAPTAGVVSANAPCYHQLERDRWFADIPQPGTPILEGFPVLTILVKGENESSVRERLMASSQEFIERFFQTTGETSESRN